MQHLLLADLSQGVASRILDPKSPAYVCVCLSPRGARSSAPLRPPMPRRPSCARCSYVCGGTKMASDVRSALVELMAGPAHLNSRDAAVKKLAEMQLKGRYLQVRVRASVACAALTLLRLQDVWS